jgi:hypothetical protein
MPRVQGGLHSNFHGGHETYELVYPTPTSRSPKGRLFFLTGRRDGEAI